VRRKVTPVEATEDGDLSFGLVAAVLNQETLILLKSRLKEWFDAKVWYSHPPVQKFADIDLWY